MRNKDMKLKLLVGLIVLAISALYPLSSLSKSDDKDSSVTLTASNLIVLNGEVNGENVAAVISKAKELCNAAKGGVTSKAAKKMGLGSETRLKLFLYTPGGSIQAGLELDEALNGLGCPVDTVTLFAASMGWQIAQNLGERLILKNGVMMSHHASGQESGEFGGSVRTQMENRQQLWLDRVRELDEQTVKRTNGKQTYESYTKEYDHEMWLTGTRSVAEGYSDRVVTMNCDASLNGVDTHTISFMGIPVMYDLDKCPINTSPMNVRVGTPDGKLTAEMSNLVKEKFLIDYTNKAKQVIPMYW
jgi:ATP-dependent protease ClpP protease subunit